MLSSAVPTTPEETLVVALRADLEAAGFTVEGLRSLWGAEADAALARGRRLPARRALSGDARPAAVLAALFVLGLPVPVAHAAAALPRTGVAGAAALGLLAVDDSDARPLLDLRPYDFVDAAGAGSWWIASDLGELATGRALEPEHVLGVGGATLTLAALLVPTPARRVLDLGTGCGILAMHASRWAEEVVATDISHRALAVAALNVALNGITGVTFRQGDMFAPVAGERFDRIVSNPPFVITPRVAGVPAYEYRDGGRVGDGIVAEVVAGLGVHLEPGGIGQLLGNWEERDGVPGLDRVAAWVDAAGLDAWVVERERQDPAQYAEVWIRDGGTRTEDGGFEALYGAWIDDFHARGVTGVGFGYLTLRRPDGATPPLRRFESVGEERPAPGLGAHVGEVLAAHDAQARLNDAAFEAAVLQVAPDVTEERSYWPGQEHPTVITLRQGAGFGRSVRADTALAAVVGACDGDLPVGVLVSAVAELLGADRADLAAEVLPRLRELVDVGMLRLDTADAA
jgi:SAM-dependent methyltransferase